MQKNRKTVWIITTTDEKNASALFAAPMTPTHAVAHLLSRIAGFQLPQRAADRGEGYRDPVVLQGFTDLRRSNGGGRHRLQDLLDDQRIGTASRSPVCRRACPCGRAGAASTGRLRS